MRYLFKETATARAQGQVSHTVMYCKTHLHLTRPLSKQMCHMMFQSSTFFSSLSHSIKAMSVFLKSVCATWEKTLLQCFSTLDQLVPLFLPSEPSETKRPQGIHLFSHSDKL